jgi:hypothetical protein
MKPHHDQGLENRDAALISRRAAILADFRGTFGTDHGKRVLALLETSVNYGKPSFLPAAGGKPYDPIAAAIRDGRKSVLAEIHGYLAEPEDGEKKCRVIRDQ